MFKKIAKILIILVGAVLVFAIGFILTLQVTEYKPDEVTVLDITDNLSDDSSNYITLSDTIKIMTFNTGYASLSATEDFVMDGGEKGRMDSAEEVQANVNGIISILEEQDADIYLLQEVDDNSARSYHINEVEQYLDAVSMPLTLGYNYRVLFVPFPFELGQMMGKVSSGIVTMANYYVDSAERIQLPGSFSWPVSLANLKRCITVERLPIADSDKEFVLINVHLSAYDDGTMRVQEMEKLKEVIQTEYALGNYVVVGGDFNQTFPEAVLDSTTVDGVTTYDYLYPLKDPSLWEAFPLVESEWFGANGFTLGVDTSTPTCRLLNQPYNSIDHSQNQYYVIDGFIVSDNVTIESVTTLDYDFLYSDHNPVAMTFHLNP